jgi:Fe-S cluster assembly scaffold protein SufB
LPGTGEPEWLVRKRQEAYNSFLSMPMPEKFHDLEILAELKKSGLDRSEAFEAGVLPGVAGNNKGGGNADGSALMANLMNEEEISGFREKGVIIESLSTSLKQHGDILRKRLYSKLHAESKFAALNSALWQDGIFIHVPDGTQLQKPIRLRIGLHGRIQLDRIVVFAGENTRFSILESIDKSDKSMQGSGNPMQAGGGIQSSHSFPFQFRLEAVELFLGEGSNVCYQTLQDLPAEVCSISMKRAEAGKDASLVWADCFFGGSISVSEVFTELAGQGATANALGLFYGKESQRFGMFLKNQHITGNTVSDMLTKGVLDGKSRSSYTGTVKIAEKARGSNGYQKQDVLLLGPEAGADAKPYLEIDNNEVRCTHGVSIGQPDGEKIFYLMSRGLSREQAKAKIVNGFFGTVLRRIGDRELRQEAEGLIGRHLGAE